MAAYVVDHHPMERGELRQGHSGNGGVRGGQRQRKRTDDT
jgi:hypothetical protein